MRNQFFMPGELPLVLLALLADRAQGGYELLGELERRFAPSYRPSPGSVYPALSALRAEGLVEQAPGHGTASYVVTEPGRRLLAEQRDALQRIEHRTSTVLESDSSLQTMLARLTARINKLGSRVDRSAVEQVIENATNAIADLEVEHGQ